MVGQPQTCVYPKSINSEVILPSSTIDYSSAGREIDYFFSTWLEKEQTISLLSQQGNSLHQCLNKGNPQRGRAEGAPPLCTTFIEALMETNSLLGEQRNSLFLLQPSGKEIVYFPTCRGIVYCATRVFISMFTFNKQEHGATCKTCSASNGSCM